LAKRATQQMMHAVFTLSRSVGTIRPLEHATRAAFAAPVEEARADVQRHKVAHLEETRWRQGDKAAWLWGAVTPWVTVFVVRLSRGGAGARALLGKTLAGMLVTER
jgi:transposase-like protein